MPEPVAEYTVTPIDDGMRVGNFLADPAITRAFAQLAGKYFDAFKQAAPQADVLKLHARVVALCDIREQLTTIVNNGKAAQLLKEREDKLEALKKGTRSR